MQLTRYHGKRYNVIYYALEMILAVGFRVRGVRGTQFRQWANAHLSEYLVKGFTINDARLKNPDGRPDYFDELLARIRDIRSSERSFYQQVADVYATATDYDPRADITREFFATVSCRRTQERALGVSVSFVTFRRAVCKQSRKMRKKQWLSTLTSKDAASGCQKIGNRDRTTIYTVLEDFAKENVDLG